MNVKTNIMLVPQVELGHKKQNCLEPCYILPTKYREQRNFKRPELSL